MEELILSLTLLVATAGLYIADYKVARKVAELHWATFEECEMNKSLVYFLLKHKETGNRTYLINQHISTAGNMILGAILVGLVGLLFDITFFTGVNLYLAATALSHAIGYIVTTHAYLKIRGLVKNVQV